jgi:hypothetical protein
MLTPCDGDNSSDGRRAGVGSVERSRAGGRNALWRVALGRAGRLFAHISETHPVVGAYAKRAGRKSPGPLLWWWVS